MNVSVGRYVLGVASLLLVCGSLALAAAALRRRFLPDADGPSGLLAASVIWLALLIGELELLGAVGLFRLVPVVLGAVALSAAAVRFCGAPRWPSPRRVTLGRRVLLAALVAGVVVAEWAGPTLSSYEFGIRGFDSLWYHLPWAASFAQTGHVTPLRFTDVEYLTPFYPASAELLHGLGIVLLGRDTLSPGLNLGWLALLLLSGWCLGRARGLGHATMLGAALGIAVPAMTLSQAGSAANDVAAIALVLAAAALLAGGDRRPPELVLGGLAAGLAIGVKLSALAPALALSAGAIITAGRGDRARTARLWLVPFALAGGYWYVRDLIAVGNPLPWLDIPGLATPPPPLQAHTAYTVAHYLLDGHALSAFIAPGLRAGLGDVWPATLVVAVIGPLLCLGRRAGVRVRMLGVVALVALVAYLLTPESAAGPAGHPLGFAFNLRYAGPALVLCLALAPLAPPLARRSSLAIGVLALLLVVTFTQGRLWPARQLLGALAIGLAVALAPLLVDRARRRTALAFGAILALVLAATAGWFWQRRYLRGRYAYQPGVSYLARVWAEFRTVHHARVAVSGTYGAFFAYPLYGLDLSNRVQYVARRGPHGSFTPIGSCSAWRAALNAGRFSYLVSTPDRDPWRPKLLTPAPEDRWTATDPAAQAVYARLAGGQRIVVYALRARLDPAACG